MGCLWEPLVAGSRTGSPLCTQVTGLHASKGLSRRSWTRGLTCCSIGRSGQMEACIRSNAGERCWSMRRDSRRARRVLRSMSLCESSSCRSSRALLPRSLPTEPGTTVAARYRSAERRHNMGGDWYAVVPLKGATSGWLSATSPGMASMRCRTWRPPATAFEHSHSMSRNQTKSWHSSTMSSRPSNPRRSSPPSMAS